MPDRTVNALITCTFNDLLNSDKHDWQSLSFKNRQTCSKSYVFTSYARNGERKRVDAGATRQQHVP